MTDVSGLTEQVNDLHLEDSDPQVTPKQPAAEEQTKPKRLLKTLAIEGVAEYIKTHKCKNIIVMSGAGISTSAGIPDFRSPKTGLYHNLQKYNLPRPEAIFELQYFLEKPEAFFTLSKGLFPGRFRPTPAHFFIRVLHEHGMLLRLFTQNIDSLDRLAGLPQKKMMEAHGTFHQGHCVNHQCKKEYSEKWMRGNIMADVIPRCKECNSLVKPDIVFFGESLPPTFTPMVEEDFPKCDLLIVIGTSLAVMPFASLVGRVPETTPRLLINKNKPEKPDPFMMLLGLGGMDLDSKDNYRDVGLLGTCDNGCMKLAELLGFKRELERYVQRDKMLSAFRGSSSPTRAIATKTKIKSRSPKSSQPSRNPSTKRTRKSASPKRTITSKAPQNAARPSPNKHVTLPKIGTNSPAKIVSKNPRTITATPKTPIIPKISPKTTSATPKTRLTETKTTSTTPNILTTPRTTSATPMTTSLSPRTTRSTPKTSIAIPKITPTTPMTTSLTPKTTISTLKNSPPILKTTSTPKTSPATPSTTSNIQSSRIAKTKTITFSIKNS